MASNLQSPSSIMYNKHALGNSDATLSDNNNAW